MKIRAFLDIRPNHKIWVLLPTVLWFPVGEDAPGAQYADLTFVWLRAGFTIRFSHERF